MRKPILGIVLGIKVWWIRKFQGQTVAMWWERDLQYTKAGINRSTIMILTLLLLYVKLSTDSQSGLICLNNIIVKQS